MTEKEKKGLTENQVFGMGSLSTIIYSWIAYFTANSVPKGFLEGYLIAWIITAIATWFAFASLSK